MTYDLREVLYNLHNGSSRKRAMQFPGLKEAYEEKSKEEGITDDALFEYMKGLVEAAQSTLSEVAPVEGEEPAADPAAEEAVAPEPEAAVEAAAE